MRVLIELKVIGVLSETVRGRAAPSAVDLAFDIELNAGELNILGP